VLSEIDTTSYKGIRLEIKRHSLGRVPRPGLTFDRILDIFFVGLPGIRPHSRAVPHAMAADENTPQSGSSRKQMLEEIRRRAEEAEMKRLEEEERRRATANKLKKEQPPPFPVDAVDPEPAANKIALEQKALVIRERLTSALERGKVDKAAELLAEFSRLSPSSEELAEFNRRLADLQEKRVRPKEESRPHATGVRNPATSVRNPAQSVRNPATSVRHSEPPSPEKAARDMQRKKINDMMEAGHAYYQQEKYDRALTYVVEVLKIDPRHEQALSLRSQIEQARVLEEKVRKEEEQHRAFERASTPTKIMDPLPIDEPAPSRPTDFWGSSLTGPKIESDYDLMPEEKGPVGPPKTPLMGRMAEKVSAVRVPVKPLLTIAAVMVFAVAVYFLVETIRNTVAPARNSVLILPALTAGDSSMTMLADAFAEDLIAELDQADDMRVISPATVFAFRGSNAAPLTLARAVGASYVLSWSATKQGSTVTVEFSFADTVRNGPVWNSRMSVDLREFPALRSDLLQNFARVMDVKLTAADGSSIFRPATTSESAYDLYARGRETLRNGSHFDANVAIAYFEQVLKLDPDFAEANAACAWAHMLAYETSPDLSQTHIAQALGNIQKAISAGLRDGEVFRAWGLAEQYRGQYAKAIEWFEKGVSIAPSDAETQRRLAIARAISGSFDAAIKAAQRSVADDRGNLVAHITLGQIHQFRAIHIADNRDEYKAALAAYEQGMPLARDRSDYSSGPYADVLVHLQMSTDALNIMLDRVARERESYLDFYKLGRVQQAAGKPIPEWQESFIRARSILSDHLLQQPEDAMAYAYLALVNTRLGAFKDAVAALGRAQQIAPNDQDVLYLTARLFALQRDKAQALSYLRKALSRRFSMNAVLDMDFYNLYSDPEFVATITPKG
jgi:tetratricopeptide (TPR) repeat protein/TolB-like protein